MAGIFNLFGESNLNKGNVMTPLSRSKTTIGISGASVKNAGPLKPKGLSIRSNFNLNVSASNKDICNKPQEYLKPKLTQLNIEGHPISPGKDCVSKKTNGCPINLSPQKASDKKNVQLQKPSNEIIFKQPSLPKNYSKKRYPEPESLAPYCDMQFEFDDIYTKTIENEFKELLMKKKNEIVPYEDERFQSEPEQLEYKMPILCTSPFSLDEEWRRCKSPDLPEPYFSDMDE
ncbi:uncharacterized protein LOC114877123 [Osmia bicornis bicornis]|uniref:uncharacterized protein LOC114877123 n=1 Tax=Osmia bicornis bicornis TaxID=1437191 RepID=UPI0010F9AD0A|nr:uncharacterized protein LOC114877123 [Osmia bicornis bicornis]